MNYIEDYLIEEFESEVENDEDYNESYDEDYENDESIAYLETDESYDERSPFRRRGTYRRPSVARRNHGKRSFKPYKGKGIINTPAGTAQVKLPSNLVTKAELKSALTAISNDIKKNSNALLKVNANLNDLNKKEKEANAILAKRNAKTDKKLNNLQQTQMMSALLGTPKLNKVTVHLKELKIKEQGPNGEQEKTLKVNQDIDLEVRKAEFDTGLQTMMALMGAMDTGGSNTMWPLMAVAMMSGNSSSGNNMMPMALAMMAMGNSNSTSEKL